MWLHTNVRPRVISSAMHAHVRLLATSRENIEVPRCASRTHERTARSPTRERRSTSAVEQAKKSATSIRIALVLERCKASRRGLPEDATSSEKHSLGYFCTVLYSYINRVRW